MRKQKVFVFLMGLVILAAATGLCASQEAAREFYVDPKKGDDANSGVIAKPFETLRHALDVVSDRVERGGRRHARGKRAIRSQSEGDARGPRPALRHAGEAQRPGRHPAQERPVV